MSHNYHDKFNEYIHNMHNIMFIFEVTKCCGYSTFITIYKNQTLLDLYSNIISHFGIIEIKELYFMSSEQERINVPISKQTITEFIRTNVICNPIKLVPVYALPIPTVYKLFMNDGRCTQPHNVNVVG